jgi:lysophospholipid acyltransferase (LPLAT)-like uncharacterized protein
VRPLFTGPLFAILLAVVPRLYVAYMWFVWKTSWVEDCGYGRGPELLRQSNGGVALFWHEEVFWVAWAYRTCPGRHTLASPGQAGELITRLLERCGFVVARGGSSQRASRQSVGLVKAMIEHMNATPLCTYGITVDGSRGPAYVAKSGSFVIARACRKPILIPRTWAKRVIRLPTWDRTAIPLPFNHIRQYLRGPFFMPEGAADETVFEAFRLRMENEMIDLAAESQRF